LDYSHLALFSLNRQDACSTRKSTLCGTGILPVQKRIIDNGARSQITNSKLQDYIDDDGLRGVLSNFQSLQAAIEAKKYAIDFSTLAHQNIK